MRIAAIILACMAFAASVGMNVGPRPADVERMASSAEYKAEQAEHLAKWEAK
jgi:hypothetical protein